MASHHTFAVTHKIYFCRCKKNIPSTGPHCRAYDGSFTMLIPSPPTQLNLYTVKVCCIPVRLMKKVPLWNKSKALRNLAIGIDSFQPWPYLGFKRWVQGQPFTGSLPGLCWVLPAHIASC